MARARQRKFRVCVRFIPHDPNGQVFDHCWCTTVITDVSSLRNTARAYLRSRVGQVYNERRGVIAASSEYDIVFRPTTGAC